MRCVGHHFKKDTAEQHKTKILKGWKKEGIKGRVSIRKDTVKCTDGRKIKQYGIYVERL